MADAKLNELIQVLKTQGLESGEEAGREAAAAARKEAESIISQAKAEAENIISESRQKADQQHLQLNSSLEIAASQFVTALKKVTEENLLVIPLRETLRGELSKPDLLREIMVRFVDVYAKNPRGADLRLLLPDDDSEDEVFEHAMELMVRHWGKGDKEKNLDLVMKDKDVQFGFQVDRTDGSVRLDFSDDAFLSLFLEYLAPRFRDLFKQVKVTETTGQ